MENYYVLAATLKGMDALGSEKYNTFILNKNNEHISISDEKDGSWWPVSDNLENPYIFTENDINNEKLIESLKNTLLQTIKDDWGIISGGIRYEFLNIDHKYHSTTIISPNDEESLFTPTQVVGSTDILDIAAHTASPCLQRPQVCEDISLKLVKPNNLSFNNFYKLLSEEYENDIDSNDYLKLYNTFKNPSSNFKMIDNFIDDNDDTFIDLLFQADEEFTYSYLSEMFPADETYKSFITSIGCECPVDFYKFEYKKNNVIIIDNTGTGEYSIIFDGDKINEEDIRGISYDRFIKEFKPSPILV